jgi:hypothetical protein
VPARQEAEDHLGIPHDGPAIFIYVLVLVSIAAVIKGSMKKSPPVSATWRSDDPPPPHGTA